MFNVTQEIWLEMKPTHRKGKFEEEREENLRGLNTWI
jgi:hypothetical protein